MERTLEAISVLKKKLEDTCLVAGESRKSREENFILLGELVLPEKVKEVSGLAKRIIKGFG